MCTKCFLFFSLPSNRPILPLPPPAPCVQSLTGSVTYHAGAQLTRNSQRIFVAMVVERRTIIVLLPFALAAHSGPSHCASATVASRHIGLIVFPLSLGLLLSCANSLIVGSSSRRLTHVSVRGPRSPKHRMEIMLTKNWPVAPRSSMKTSKP